MISIKIALSKHTNEVLYSIRDKRRPGSVKTAIIDEILEERRAFRSVRSKIIAAVITALLVTLSKRLLVID